ncbi:MAG: 16S rRNA (cytosine(967)-C(5))-methyltransferase RsmB [Lachnospiraceae bacterium]|nr:16S rRNA (cytosine(967)-C(5))-methyltransferase RsmB [Lachnospiraceae bacterium]
MKADARSLALDVLLDYAGRDDGRLDYAVEARLAEAWPGSEGAFAKALAFQCVQRQLYLDFLISRFSHTPIKKLRPQIRWILRMGICELYFMERNADYAAINECVSLAKKRGFAKLSGYVNAVLRQAERCKENPPLPSASEETLNLSILYSCPEWIVRLWLSAYGKTRTVSMLEASLAPRPLTVWITKDLPEKKKEELLLAWEEAGIIAASHPSIDNTYYLNGVSGIRELPGYKNGWFFIQDSASVLPVLAAGIKGHEKILDVCASPGAKSVYAAEFLKEGKILAGDISKSKIRKLEENIRRMRREETIQPALRDGTVSYSQDQAKFDIVFVDAPCSGLGVLSRKPDLKYRLKETDLQDLAELQRKLLKASASCVKRGGLLVYSVCTLSPMENEEQSAWVQKTLPMMPSLLPKGFANGLSGVRKQGHELYAFPGALQDGFYLACFQRK